MSMRKQKAGIETIAAMNDAFESGNQMLRCSEPSSMRSYGVLEDLPNGHVSLGRAILFTVLQIQES